MGKSKILDIINKIKFNPPLSYDEIAYINHILDSGGDDLCDLGNAVYAFGLLEQPSDCNIHRIEKYLYICDPSYNHDILISSTVKSLCTFWGLTDKYCDRIMYFLREEYIDMLSDTQRVGVIELGQYVYKSHDKLILRFLYDLFVDRLCKCDVDDRTYSMHLLDVYQSLYASVNGAINSWYFMRFSYIEDIDKDEVDGLLNAVKALIDDVD